MIRIFSRLQRESNDWNKDEGKKTENKKKRVKEGKRERKRKKGQPLQ